MRLGFAVLTLAMLAPSTARADVVDAGPDAAVEVKEQPADPNEGLNLAGGAEDDNKCAVHGVGAPGSAFGAAALALVVSVWLTRRRRD